MHGDLESARWSPSPPTSTRLYAPLTQLSNVNLDVMTTLVSFERVFEVLDLVPMIEERPDAVAIPRGPATVEFDHVDFSYPSAEEVSLASLEAVATLESHRRTRSSTTCRSGSSPGQMRRPGRPVRAPARRPSPRSPPGSTTSTAGAVRVSGVDVRDATLASLHDVVGVVTQDAHLFHDTLRANLLYARPDASDGGARTSALEQAQILAPRRHRSPTGSTPWSASAGYRLSGGEKQRVALARLILKAPDVVVLDEATAHLDSESEAAVQQALRTALGGRTSMVIAHRLSTVREADQLLVSTRAGSSSGAPTAELLDAGGLYAELYRTQFADQDDDDPASDVPLTPLP